MTIKLMKYYVTDGNVKSRVFYSHYKTDNRECVTIYAKDYDRSLGKIFGTEYKNETDIMSDYFDQGQVSLYPGHPLFNAALERCKHD